jgi:hypothetical protein
MTPSASTIALAPGFAEVGDTARTTVIRANGFLSDFRLAALSSSASLSILIVYYLKLH